MQICTWRAASRAPEGVSEFCFRKYFYENLDVQAGLRRGRLSRAWNEFLNKVDINLKKMVGQCWFKNVIGINWLHFLNFLIVQALTFVKSRIWIIFTKGTCEKISEFVFWSFWSCRKFKIHQFCQKKCLTRFSSCGKLAN